MYTFLSAARGVTLVEMLSALVVSTLLMGGAWELVLHGKRSYQRGLAEVRTTQAVRTLLHIVTQDVQRAMAARVPHGMQSPTGPATGASSGERLTLLTHPPSRLQTPEAGVGEGPQRIRYILSPQAGQPTQALQRVSTPLHGGPPERRLPLHEQIHAMQVRYFDGQTWSDTWQQAALPRAVEVTLQVPHGPAPARMRSFTTLITADGPHD